MRLSFLKRLYRLLYWFGIIKFNYTCPVCNHNIFYYFPLPKYYKRMLDKYGYIYSNCSAETLNQEGYSCYECGSTDRDRLYALFIHQKIQKSSNQLNLIDFAPSHCLKEFIKSHQNVTYKCADLYMNDVDDRVDITDMKIYHDEQFDIFICSHVLEHVKNPDQALCELYRILKFGGWGIIMVPIILGLEDTVENPEYTTIEDRWKYYGQDDHLRMFGKRDFIERITKVGFKVSLYDINHFGEDIYYRAGISKTSVLYIAEKL